MIVIMLLGDGGRGGGGGGGLVEWAYKIHVVHDRVHDRLL